MADQSLSYDSLMSNIPLTIAHQCSGAYVYTLANEDGPLASISSPGPLSKAEVEAQLMALAGISPDDKYGAAPMWDVSWV